jgi:hypothetical protein
MATILPASAVAVKNQAARVARRMVDTLKS